MLFIECSADCTEGVFSESDSRMDFGEPNSILEFEAAVETDPSRACD